MTNLKDFQDDFVLFTELGFIANNQSDSNSATELFIAAELLRPNHPLPNIGRGYMYLLQLKVSQAEAQLEMALKKDPQNEQAKALIAFGQTLKSDKKEVSKGAETIQILKKSAKADIQTLANTLWNFYEKIVQKTVTPGPVSPPASPSAGA